MYDFIYCAKTANDSIDIFNCTSNREIRKHLKGPRFMFKYCAYKYM